MNHSVEKPTQSYDQDLDGHAITTPLERRSGSAVARSRGQILRRRGQSCAMRASQEHGSVFHVDESIQGFRVRGSIVSLSVFRSQPVGVVAMVVVVVVRQVNPEKQSH